MPLVWLRSWRRVIAVPSWPCPSTRPGRCWSTVSSRSIRRSPWSWRRTVATKVLVTEPMRKRSSAPRARPVSRSAVPAVPFQTP
ncbi:hypothetical protein P405_06290 [Streptomyces sp. FR-008]|nr:hypothetical protein P405_06290 [Streptomyces sp. FR-008]